MIMVDNITGSSMTLNENGCVNIYILNMEKLLANANGYRGTDKHGSCYPMFRIRCKIDLLWYIRTYRMESHLFPHLI